jgi:glycosyltransferase involved in cell wall biosynthesis
MMDDFLYKIKNHPERNRNLIYLNHPNDRTLQSYYLNSWALIYPSYDEGFGLPIIEASYYNLPLIVRDKEVFREIAGDNAYYFKDTKEPFDIYQAILNWMRLERQKSYPQSKNINYLSWRDSTKWLLEILNSKKIC